MERPRRKRMRWACWDYTNACMYFITICAKDRKPLFWLEERAGLEPAPTGPSDGWERMLNPMGRMVLDTWNQLPCHIPNIELVQFVVMPNHVHGIVGILSPGPVGAGSKPAPPAGLPEIIRQFKTFSARRINNFRNTPGASVWQRSYYDHIIRNEQALRQIWTYISTNPSRWREDEYYRG